MAGKPWGGFKHSAVGEEAAGWPRRGRDDGRDAPGGSTWIYGLSRWEAPRGASLIPTPSVQGLPWRLQMGDGRHLCGSRPPAHCQQSWGHPGAGQDPPLAGGQGRCQGAALAELTRAEPMRGSRAHTRGQLSRQRRGFSKMKTGEGHPLVSGRDAREGRHCAAINGAKHRGDSPAPRQAQGLAGGERGVLG